MFGIGWESEVFDNNVSPEASRRAAKVGAEIVQTWDQEKSNILWQDVWKSLVGHNTAIFSVALNNEWARLRVLTYLHTLTVTSQLDCSFFGAQEWSGRDMLEECEKSRDTAVANDLTEQVPASKLAPFVGDWAYRPLICTTLCLNSGGLSCGEFRFQFVLLLIAG